MKSFPPLRQICGFDEKEYEVLILESTVSFAPLRPAGFVNFSKAGQGLLFPRAGRGSLFFRGAGWLGPGHP